MVLLCQRLINKLRDSPRPGKYECSPKAELASELYCERGEDHSDLVTRARADRRKLGHNIDESAVLCVRCMKAIALKA